MTQAKSPTRIGQETVAAGDYIADYPEHVVAHKDVSLTSAQLLALHATPVSLVPAPGAGYALVFEWADIYYVFGATPYTIGGDLAVQYTDGSGTKVGSAAGAGFLDQSTNQHRRVSAYRAASSTGGAIDNTANAALVIYNLTGENTVGDGTVKVRIYYRKVKTSAPF